MGEELNMDKDQAGAGLRNIRMTTIDTKTRSFIVQYLAGLTYANKDYHRFGHRESPKCSFCDEQRQTRDHLFRKCEKVNEFWETVEQEVTREVINERHRLLGSGDVGLDYITFHAAQYIHRKNFHKEKLSILEFKGLIRKHKTIEEEIARSRGSLKKHNIKWGNMATYL